MLYLCKAPSEPKHLRSQWRRCLVYTFPEDLLSSRMFDHQDSVFRRTKGLS